MIRYYSKTIPSHKVRALADKHIPRLGLIYSITGKRFTSTRTYKLGERNKYITNHEVVVVKGENGTATFSGVCWSYSGEGPHALIDLLLLCGLSRDLSQIISFFSPRNETDGIDWIYDVRNGNLTTCKTVVEKKERHLPPNYIAAIAG